MKKIFSKIARFFSNLWSKEGVRAFCYIFILGLFCLSIRAITNHFTLPMYGDYTMQTYAFYSQGYHVFWDFIKTGQYPLFDFSNYLGANYLGTQSFYYVYSPLFYLLCLWPEALLYQGIFFHMVFKFALGGFFMYILLRKYFHVSFKMSTIGGFIYSLSGWSLFYIWFHFGDVMAFFPLFIIGIERTLKERKGDLLAVGTFLCGLSCYFFLVNFLLFGVAYALYRWIYIYGVSKKRGFSAKVRWGVLLQGILYAFAGILIACICLFPSLHVVMSSNRNQSSTSYLLELLSAFFIEPTKVDGVLVLGKFRSLGEMFSFENLGHLLKTLFIWPDRKVGAMEMPGILNVGYMLSNWIYMNTNCWDNIMFDNVSLDNSIGGFFITTPLTMLLIPSIVEAFKSKRPWTIFGLIMCIVMPLLPITAHAAFGFTSLYGRWQIWIVMIGLIFIIPTLDRIEKVDRRLITVNLIFNYTLAVIVYFIAKNTGKMPTDHVFNILGMKIPGMVLITIAELLVMLIVWFIYRFKFFKPAIIKNIMIIIIVIEIGASSVITVEQKGYHKWNSFYLSQPQYDELIDVVDDIKESNPDSFYRIMNTEATRSIMNLPSALNYNGASSFNSTYDFDLDVFKNRSRMAYGGGWTMGNHEKRYWLDQYIGTKYYIIDKKDINNDNKEYDRDLTVEFDGRESMNKDPQNYRINMGWNYDLVKEYEYLDVYENTNFIGIGYTVDNYMSSQSAGTGRMATHYEELYSTTAIIENDDMEMIKEKSESSTEILRYREQYDDFSRSNWDYYFSPREDSTFHLTHNYDRQEYKIKDSSFSKKEVIQYLPENGQFFHRRWISKGYFGDKFILKLKDGEEKLASKATDDNLCFVNMTFKLGPKVLISFYNGDTLVTQDAHSHSNSSLNNNNYEWKLQRGFYLNQPVDKIIVEFIDDTRFEKIYSGNNLPSRTFEINYAYQNDIQKMQDEVNERIFKNVKYHNNKFTFDGVESKNKIAVTNIPYDAGWTLKANGEPLDIFKVNGGFVGFITPTGEVNYELSYFTPYLKEGLIATGTGILMLIALCFVYKNTKSSILICENQIENVYLNSLKENEEKELNNFKDKSKELFKKFISKFKKKNKPKEKK